MIFKTRRYRENCRIWWVSHFQAKIQQRENFTLNTFWGFLGPFVVRQLIALWFGCQIVWGYILVSMLAMVDQRSFILTDSYISLSKYGFECQQMVKLQKCFVRPNDKLIYTQKIERQWRKLRSSFSSVARKDHTLKRQNVIFGL